MTSEHLPEQELTILTYIILTGDYPHRIYCQSSYEFARMRTTLASKKAREESRVLLAFTVKQDLDVQGHVLVHI